MEGGSRKIGDLAASVGIQRVHVLSWRDLADVEAGGSEIHAARVAKLWAEAGLDVTLRSSYAQGQPTTVRRDGYQVVRRAGRYATFPRSVLSELAGRMGPRDALVEYWNGMPFFSPLWARGPSVVVLHHVHAEMWRMVLGDAPRLARAGELLEGRIAPLAYRRRGVVTLSPSSKTEIVRRLGVKPERVRVVPPGIDERFTPGSGEKHPRPLVVAVGRLVPVKRYDLLLEACAVARQRVPDLELVIVGEGYERPRLDDVVAQIGGDPWVTFAGQLHDHELVDLYQRAWVVASASSHEGWGMTLTEAAACGTPVVATRIAGHTDSVLDGVTGVLIDGRADAFGGALADLLADDQARRRLSNGAQARAGELTWEATATGLMAALVADARSRRPR